MIYKGLVLFLEKEFIENIGGLLALLRKAPYSNGLRRFVAGVELAPEVKAVSSYAND